MASASCAGCSPAIWKPLALKWFQPLCAWGVARGAAQHSPSSRSQELFASCRISSLKPSEALPSRPSSGPFISLPFPLLLEPKSSNACREILTIFPLSFLAYLVGLGGGCAGKSLFKKPPRKDLHFYILCAFCRVECFKRTVRGNWDSSL